MSGSATSSPLGKEYGGTCHLCPSIGSISVSEDRINALFSPFRPKDLNPESYDRKMIFFIKAIEEFVTFGHRLTFTLKELQLGLMINKKSPACLEEVLQELSSKGQVLSEKEYYDFLKASSSWASWSQVLAKKVVLKLVPMPSFSWFGRGGENATRFIHVAYLKTIVDEISKNSSIKNKLMSFSSFKEMITLQTKISEETELVFILDYLKTNKLIQMDKVGHEEVVRFGDGLGISDVEKGTYDVRRSKELHEEKIEQLHIEIDKCKENAKKALKQERRATAKHELRKKKLLEQRLDKLLTVVDSLTVISMKIDEAENDAMILSAYKSGKQALSDVLKKNNLTVDSVSDAMLDVQEILEEQAEIAAEISKPLDGQGDEAAELDAELELLLQEDEDKQKKRKEELGRMEEEEALRKLERLQVADGFDSDESMLNISNKNDSNVPSPTIN